MTIGVERERMENALKAIGVPEIAFKENLVRDIRKVLAEKGYDAAIVSAEQYCLGTDVNAELVRIMMVCRRYGLDPVSAAQVLNILSSKASVEE